MNKIYYIGSFPPPYGGVTIKNELLRKKLSQTFQVKTSSDNLINTGLFLVPAVFGKSPVAVGISAVRGKSLFITKLLYYFNKGKMKKSVYFMMGGLEADRIANNDKEIKMYSTYKKVYVETKTMEQRLLRAGVVNAELYPNCREVQNEMKPALGRKNRCVFFSLISKNKGADMVLDVADNFPDVQFDFYGEIDPAYKEEFISELDRHSNANYYGVFHSDQDNVYYKLAEYDALLFPTRWKNEGVPGVIVESKFAGIPTIASEIAYNAELIQNNVDGVLFPVNSVEEFGKCIQQLYSNDENLSKLKFEAAKSARVYDIDTYLPDIIACLK